MSFGFSWKQAAGISGAKRKISRAIGIPTTKGGRKRKAQNMLWKSAFWKAEKEEIKNRPGATNTESGDAKK